MKSDAPVEWALASQRKRGAPDKLFKFEYRDLGCYSTFFKGNAESPKTVNWFAWSNERWEKLSVLPVSMIDVGPLVAPCDIRFVSS